jgi:flagellar protein FlgJ
MDISTGASQYYIPGNIMGSTSKTDKITSALNNKSASDEELMEACKSFEAYLLEQAFKGMEKTIMKNEEEEENPYLTQFGDMLYEEYAESAAEKQSLGLAQMLYEAMKRNTAD